jgi:outer membrane receptor protein involved in Fe transport
MVYASAAKGFRPGGVNSSFSAALCQADLANLGLTQGPTGFNSDKLWTYEAGSKNEFLSGRATLNGAVYYTDWKNIQQTILLPSCGFAFTGNVGAAEIKGAELSGKFAVTHGLTAGASASYSDATITQTAPGVSAQVGQPVLDTPKWIASAFVDYIFDIGPDSVSLRAEYQFHGSQLRDFSSTYTALAANGTPIMLPNPSQRLKAYQVVNLNATWEHDGWQVQAFVQNLFDRAPIIDYNPTEPMSQALTLRPRTIGMSLRKHFE